VGLLELHGGHHACAPRIRLSHTFATARLRQRITKGPGSRAAGVAMAFKLIESAQQRWRAVNAPHLVPLVRAGARFEKGKLVERPNDQGGEQQVACASHSGSSAFATRASCTRSRGTGIPSGRCFPFAFGM